jgi:ribose transport system permease protein
MRSRATWILILDLVLIALFTAISRNHVFFSLPSFQSLSINMAESLLLALGMSMLLGAGIFDLSIGANLVLSAVIGAKVIASFQGVPGSASSYSDPWLAISAGLVACLATGVLFGLINGLIITVGGVNSLIATLATFGIGTGMAYLISGGSDIGAMPPVLQEQIGLRKIGGIVPLPAVIALIAFAVLWVAVRYLRYGMRVQAIGSSKTAADRAGVPVRNYLLSLTMLAGLLASMAGFIDVAKFGSTSLAGHGNDALAAVTAAVIGGTLLEGGFISIIGTLWGAALAVILQSGLVISGVSAFWQLIAVGVVLLVAVLLDRVAARRRDRAR